MLCHISPDMDGIRLIIIACLLPFASSASTGKVCYSLAVGSGNPGISVSESGSYLLPNRFSVTTSSGDRNVYFLFQFSGVCALPSDCPDVSGRIYLQAVRDNPNNHSLSVDVFWDKSEFMVPSVWETDDSLNPVNPVEFKNSEHANTSFASMEFNLSRTVKLDDRMHDLLDEEFILTMRFHKFRYSSPKWSVIDFAKTSLPERKLFTAPYSTTVLPRF